MKLPCKTARDRELNWNDYHGVWDYVGEDADDRIVWTGTLSNQQWRARAAMERRVNIRLGRVADDS